MKTFFMHVFLSLPERSSVLPSRPELMDIWILHGDLSVTPVKVFLQDEGMNSVTKYSISSILIRCVCSNI